MTYRDEIRAWRKKHAVAMFRVAAGHKEFPDIWVASYSWCRDCPWKQRMQKIRRYTKRGRLYYLKEHKPPSGCCHFHTEE